MVFLKRFFFFTMVNILIIFTLQLVIMGLEAYFGINLSGYYTQMIIIYTAFGMGGAFFSLFASKWLAKRGMRIQMIDPKTTHPTEKWLINSVYDYARKAGLKKMPEVGVYASPEMNAFATGPSRNNSMVAVSSGLLESMNQDEVEGVLGHEVTHIANGDMVTMTLIQGVVNSIVMIISRIITDIIASKMDERGRYFARFVIYMAVSTVLALFGSLLVNWFSRHREFKADYGGAKYAGKDKMIKALQRLQMGQGQRIGNPVEEPVAIAALKISGPTTRAAFVKRLFMTHPPLDERIRALKANSI